MKQVLEGWLEVDYEYPKLYPTRKLREESNPYKARKVAEALREFDGHNIRITIEVIDDTK